MGSLSLWHVLAVLALVGAVTALVFRAIRKPGPTTGGAPISPPQATSPPAEPPSARPAAPAVPLTAPPAAAAPGYVFISYSSKDKPTADAVCAVMEQRGVRCWIAPRDIRAGHDWAESVLRAISGARVCVLIFSSAANASGQVRREIERAVHHELPIIPFRIEDAAPSESLEYFISTPHWLDAITPPLEAHAIQLADSALALMRERPAASEAGPA